MERGLILPRHSGNKGVEELIIHRTCVASGDFSDLRSHFSLRLCLWQNSRERFSQCPAHANSVARIARPAGITRNAGPGRTIKATPNNSTVPPITAMATRLIRDEFFFCISWKCARAIGRKRTRDSPGDWLFYFAKSVIRSAHVRQLKSCWRTGNLLEFRPQPC